MKPEVERLEIELFGKVKATAKGRFAIAVVAIIIITVITTRYF